MNKIVKLTVIGITVIGLAGCGRTDSTSRALGTHSVNWYKNNMAAAKKENAMCSKLPVNPKTNVQMIRKGNTMVPISENMYTDCVNANKAIFND